MIDPAYLSDIAMSGDDKSKTVALYTVAKYISHCHDIMMKHIGPEYKDMIADVPTFRQQGQQTFMEDKDFTHD